MTPSNPPESLQFILKKIDEDINAGKVVTLGLIQPYAPMGTGAKGGRLRREP